MALRGISDIIICYRGRFTVWELKRSEKEFLKGSDRQPLQQYHIDKVKEAGGRGEFVYPENFEEKLNELLNNN